MTTAIAALFAEKMRKDNPTVADVHVSSTGGGKRPKRKARLFSSAYVGKDGGGNPYHDEDGRFSSGPGGAGGSNSEDQRFHLQFKYTNPEKGWENTGNDVKMAPNMESAAHQIMRDRNIPSITIVGRHMRAGAPASEMQAVNQTFTNPDYRPPAPPASKPARGRTRKIELSRARHFAGQGEESSTGHFSFSTPIVKTDEDQHLVFGWASVIEENGKPVIDQQGDIISERELENAFYGFAKDARIAGEMHDRIGVGDLVECVVFTRDKQEALGVDLGKVGAWVGFRLEPDVFAKVKSGEYRAFSIGGRGARTAI